MDQGDGPHRVLGKWYPAKALLCHVVKDEVHRGGVCLALVAELVAETEAARIEVGADGDALSCRRVKQQVVNQEVVILEDDRLLHGFADGDLFPVIEPAPRVHDEENLLGKQGTIGEGGKSILRN